NDLGPRRRVPRGARGVLVQALAERLALVVWAAGVAAAAARDRLLHLPSRAGRISWHAARRVRCVGVRDDVDARVRVGRAARRNREGRHVVRAWAARDGEDRADLLGPLS